MAEDNVLSGSEMVMIPKAQQKQKVKCAII